MKTVTIRQPWASMIMNGSKTIEVRSWKTNYRGELAIHAGQKVEKEIAAHYDYSRDDLPTGVILGVVNLIEIMEFTPGLWRTLKHEHKNLGPFKENYVGWILDKPRLLRKFIPYKGQLGLFDVDF